MSGHQEPESLAVYSLYDCLYSQDAQAGGRLCGVRATAVSKRFLTMCCKEVTTVSTPDKSVSYNELELSKEEMGSHVTVWCHNSSDASVTRVSSLTFTSVSAKQLDIQR